jgi:hypothetical protein
MTVSDFKAENRVTSLKMNVGEPPVERDFMLFDFTKPEGSSRLWWAFKDIQDITSVGIEATPSKWWSNRWNAWESTCSNVFPPGILCLRKSQRWTPPDLFNPAAVGPFPEEDESRVLDVAGVSSLGAFGLMPRWCILPRGSGGMAPQNKTRMRFLLTAYLNELGPPRSPCWKFQLVLSERVAETWRWPCGPVGPDCQTVTLEVAHNAVSLVPLKRLKDSAEAQDADPLVKRAAALLDSFLQKLQEPLCLDSTVPLLDFVLQMAVAGHTEHRVLTKVYLFGQVALAMCKRFEAMLLDGRLEIADPFPDTPDGNRRRTMKYNIAGRNTIGAPFELQMA